MTFSPPPLSSREIALAVCTLAFPGAAFAGFLYAFISVVGSL